MVILGISANSRVLGLAIVENNQLIDFKVQLYKERWSAVKANKMIASLHSSIQEHTIKSVAVTIPHAHYTTPATKALVTRIKAHCRKKKIRFSTCDPATLHCLCEASKAKKKALMSAMVSRYPELEILYKKELKNRNRYYHKLFEAVGAATLLANTHY